MDDMQFQTAETIIVVGGSAGGIDAFKQVLGTVPADIQAAIAIVLHTSPGNSRMLADLWNEHSALPVSYATDGQPIRTGHVYVAPPDQHLQVSTKRCLRLDNGPKVLYLRPSVDQLFETAVRAYGNRTIGVILTGGDDDGLHGMRAIHAAGGIGIVQEPSDAKDPSMPLTSLRADHPRYCVPLRDIGELLSDLAARLA